MCGSLPVIYELIFGAGNLLSRLAFSLVQRRSRRTREKSSNKPLNQG
jgi:hypothetical protein